MKKILIIFMIALLAVGSAFMLIACGDTTPEDGEPIKVKIVVPDGAPTLALAKLIKERPSYEGYEISYQIVPGATEIGAAFANASDPATFAITPTNLAAVLNKNTGAKLLSVNVHGVLYIVGGTGMTATSLNDLKGEVLYSIGRAGTPGITFKHILDENGIKYVEDEDSPAEDEIGIKYVESGADLIPMLKMGEAKFGLLGEPAATASVANAGTSILFNLQELWEDATDGVAYTQASLIGQAAFLNDSANKNFIEWLLVKVEENDEWVLDNAADASNALKDAGATSVPAARAVIERCNITTVRAKDIKEDVVSYLAVLHAFNPQTVGGVLPSDSFFYIP
ncbi:MAG: hypothetical protein WC292_02715 [Clostridia bacterium]